MHLWRMVELLRKEIFGRVMGDELVVFWVKPTLLRKVGQACHVVSQASVKANRNQGWIGILVCDRIDVLNV